jgi:hypothetical protein
VQGLLVTRPSRIAADLLAEREDPQAVGYLVADALRNALDYPHTIAAALAPLANRYGFAPADGLAVLEWLLDLTDAPERQRWLAESQNNHDGDTPEQDE